KSSTTEMCATLCCMTPSPKIVAGSSRWQGLVWLVAFSQLTLALFLAGCKPAGSAGSQSLADKPPQKVLYVPAVQEQVSEVVELVARAAADQSVSIRSRVSGFLREIHFQDG